MANISIKTTCPSCGKSHNVIVKEEDYNKWKAGAYVQVAFPYLNAAEREMLITGICDPCWKKYF